MSRPRGFGQGLAAVEAALDTMPVTLVGHPFAPIGMGEQLRSHLSACRAVGVEAQVHDVFGYAERDDPEHRAAILDCEAKALPPGVRIFHINGDEVGPVLDRLRSTGQSFRAGINIIVPAWELPAYPEVWARKVRRFDDVWALSRFIGASLAAGGVSSHLVGQSVEAWAAPGESGPLLPRRAFGLRDSAFVLLGMFDASSYEARKNPLALLALLDRVGRARPLRDVQLVLKVKDGEGVAPEWVQALEADRRIKVVSGKLDSLGVRSLLAACDVFVSLHRSEGFGRGMGEAMARGRVAMGTGWSGNLDFMNAGNSLLVASVPVAVGERYPHGAGQDWAEPDLDDAARLLLPVLDDGVALRALARRGQAEVLMSHGHRAVGLRILGRLEAIALGTALGGLSEPARRRAVADAVPASA